MLYREIVYNIGTRSFFLMVKRDKKNLPIYAIIVQKLSVKSRSICDDLVFDIMNFRNCKFYFHFIFIIYYLLFFYFSHYMIMIDTFVRKQSFDNKFFNK